MKNPPLKPCLALLFIASILFTSGCASIVSRIDNDFKTKGRITQVYPATVLNAGFFTLAFTNRPQDWEGAPLRKTIWARSGIILGNLIDLPISLVTDTVLLPYDIATRKKKKTEAPEPPEPMQPAGNPAQSKEPRSKPRGT